ERNQSFKGDQGNAQFSLCCTSTAMPDDESQESTSGILFLERCAMSRPKISSRREGTRPAKLFHFRCDPPGRPAGVFYAATLVFIFFLHRLLNGNRACVQRASISRVNVRHVDVDICLDWRPAGRAVGDHDPTIVDPNFGMP